MALRVISLEAWEIECGLLVAGRVIGGFVEVVFVDISVEPNREVGGAENAEGFGAV
jgi:hypothetical protein